MAREDEIERLKEKANNIKNEEDAYAILYYMLEHNFKDNEMQEVLEELKLPGEVKETICKK